MSERITVIIADDHHVVRKGIRGFLDVQPDLHVLDEAGNGEIAVQKVTELAPDVILMDLVMPGMGGVEAIRQVKNVSPHTQIVVLTSYYDDEYIFPALRAGALSYILKDIQPDELAATIRRAAKGESHLHPLIAARVVAEIRGSKSIPPNPFLELSERELEILRLIADGNANLAIAAQLSISERTVKGHVSNILGKLHMMDRTQAAVFAWQQGLIQRK